jgi:hypothetical protein
MFKIGKIVRFQTVELKLEDLSVVVIVTKEVMISSQLTGFVQS